MDPNMGNQWDQQGHQLLKLQLVITVQHYQYQLL